MHDDAPLETHASVAPGSAGETVLAVLYGEPLKRCPTGLYIPPDALRVILERFEGPLDLLLYFIRSQKFDVMDIPMATLTDQYMAYMEIVRRSNLELAAAYLVMAATLMQIKSRLLLPKRPAHDEEGPEDPRAELMARLLEYERIRAAAKKLDAMPRLGRDFQIALGACRDEQTLPDPDVDAHALAEAWMDVVARGRLHANHRVARQELSVREHMAEVLRRLSRARWLTYESLLRESTDGNPKENAAVWCLALLELAKEHMVRITQATPYGPIYVTHAAAEGLQERLFDEPAPDGEAPPEDDVFA